jgi:hypothetical protein
MLHPLGNLPARVYWRRRLVFIGLPLLVIVLLLWAALSSGGNHSNPRAAASTTTKPASSAQTTTSAQPRDPGSVAVSTTTPKATSTAASSSPASTASKAAAGKGSCSAGALDVAAGTDKKSFTVKSQPGLSMLVTNTSGSACKLDVADKHDEWRVYSGDARVWDSHDCAVRSGSHVITLSAQQAIRLSITWSGLTSLPKCAGTRMAVQAGTYTLYAYFDGKKSPSTTFTVK